MADAQEIEANVIADFRTLLDAASIDNALWQALATPTVPGVYVGVLNLTGSLPAGLRPSGFYRVDVMLDCVTDIDDDASGAALETLAGQVRNAIFYDDLVSKLNAASSYNTYYDWDHGEQQTDTEGRLRHARLPLTLHMRPSQ